MTAGTIALQGGAEFSPRCRDLDLAILATAPFGPIVVLAGAAEPGEQYERTNAHGVAAHRRLVDDEVLGAPDPREDLEGAIDVLARASTVVLPGGSPGGLLDVLRLPGVTEVLRDRWQAGATISGSSAGAMVLGERTWVPDRDEVVDGLGFAPGIVRPHHDGDDVRRFRGDATLLRWGLPECGGVLVTGDEVHAVGVPGAVVARDDEVVPVPDVPTPVALLFA